MARRIRFVRELLLKMPEHHFYDDKVYLRKAMLPTPKCHQFIMMLFKCRQHVVFDFRGIANSLQIHAHYYRVTKMPSMIIPRRLFGRSRLFFEMNFDTSCDY